MDILFAIVIIFVGSYVQSSIGFGLAIIAAPLLFFIDPAYVPAPITVCAFVLSIINSYGHRRAISLKGLKFSLIGRVPGTIAGGLLLLWIDQKLLALWIGGSVIFAVLLSFKLVALKPTPSTLFTAGFLSGFMGTSSSIGGPPMALVLQHQRVDYIRANLSAFFVVSCLMSIIMLSSVGLFGLRQILLALPLLPATLAGYWVATRTLHLVSDANLRIFSLTLCGIAGVAAITSFFI
ncbi:MAG: permease [SAR86 cluster bacterium]|uniref:Probable membrane transporter protein n=1 Tax=SAR86 cluster bacterium TaxID=2030880 RepID=A0A2A4MG70_9GAMM|nr:MAG: permease [SAR86 cluster bacterium]